MFDASSPMAESCDKLPSPLQSTAIVVAPSNSGRVTPSIKEAARQATRKVPLAAAARQRATPSLGKNTWPIENDSERLFAARCQRDERFLTRSKELDYEAITDAFNVKAAVVGTGIRPKTAKDVRDFFQKMLLSASAATFAMDTVDSTSNISGGGGEGGSVTATAAKAVKQQMCLKCNRPQEPGHYIRAYEKVGDVWKPTQNICRFADGEEAYNSACAAKRKRNEEAAARKVAARKLKRQQQTREQQK
jgi:hypothetical protein